MIRPMWNRWDWSSDPFSGLHQLERQVNRLFRDAHGRGTDYPSLNYWSGDSEAYLEIEMPGVDPNDFELTVSDDVVTIAGERKNPHAADQDTAHRHTLPRRRGAGQCAGLRPYSQKSGPRSLDSVHPQLVRAKTTIVTALLIATALFIVAILIY